MFRLAPSDPAAPLHHIPHTLSIPRSAASTTFPSYKLVAHSRAVVRLSHIGVTERGDTLWKRFSIDEGFVSQLLFYGIVSVKQVAYCRLTCGRTIFPAVYFTTIFQLFSVNDVLRNACKGTSEVAPD